MRICAVEVIPYGIPIDGFADAYASFATSNAVIVKLRAQNGVEGIGEACAWEPEFYGETLESISSTITNYLEAGILGRDPFDIDPIMAWVDSKLAKVTCVKEGINLALYDLVGKLLGVPVSTLLGGRFRESIPVAAEIGVDTPETMAQNALRLVERGFRVIKIKGSPDMTTDIPRIRGIREAVGPDILLRLDPNAAWTTPGTLRVMQAVEDCDLELLEQPIPGWDLKGMARIRQAIDVPLMADEGIWTPQDVVKLSEEGSADIINIKIAKSAGLSLAKRIEAVAEAVGMPCIIGTEIEPGMSLIAKLHLASSLRQHPYASEFTELSLLKANVLDYDVKIVNGEVAVPDGPGFGVNLDERVLQQYRLKI